MNLAIALAAAACLGLGFVLQQEVAHAEPVEEALRLRLLVHLVTKPRWLAGIAAMVCGQVLGALALGDADVALVEPLLATNLLFALILAHALYRRHFGRGEWTGAVVLSVGVAAFVAAGAPHGGRLPENSVSQWTAGIVVACLAVLLVAVALRRSLHQRAMLVASAAGLLYGIQDALTRASLIVAGDGLRELVTTWQPYAVVLVAIVGLLLAQSAFDMAPLRVSLPALTAAEPLSGIVIGVVVFDEQLRMAGPALAVQAGGIVAMVIGIILLGRAPFLVEPTRRREHAARRKARQQERNATRAP